MVAGEGRLAGPGGRGVSCGTSGRVCSLSGQRAGVRQLHLGRSLVYPDTYSTRVVLAVGVHNASRLHLVRQWG